MVSKISQTVHWWHVSRCGWVRPDTGESSGRLNRGQLSSKARKAIVILLGLLHKILWLDIYAEKKSSTH